MRTPAAGAGGGDLGGTGFEELTLSVVQGETYDFVVDGYAGAVSAFEISVDCTKL